ncbi:hypothetical protein KY366_04270 [Candidatus Woesearchaeota archaeon]|nr:hypothetical protein [Candidatus Woesearchaeota archaeon]
MVQVYKEKVRSNFDGTIIDIETIGSFRRAYSDSRRYKDIIPVIFGFIDQEGLTIHCAKRMESINKLKEEIKKILPKLKRPFHAFNSVFERGAFFHQLGEQVLFEKELNKERFEGKRLAVSTLKIPQYNDPFNDKGELCMAAWLKGELEKAVAHNRSCLLKERDILFKRGFREPDELKLIDD